MRKSDHFRARVVAVGPTVSDPLVCPGAEVVILTWADDDDLDGTRRGMYTGVDGPDGQLFVKWPQDFGGCVLNAPPLVTDASATYAQKLSAYMAWHSPVPPQAPDAPE